MFLCNLLFFYHVCTHTRHILLCFLESTKKHNGEPIHGLIRISFQVEIIVTGDDNSAPSFTDTEYDVFVTDDSTDVIIDLSLLASDPDAPSFGTGEITFDEVSQTDENSEPTGDFLLDYYNYVLLMHINLDIYSSGVWGRI